METTSHLALPFVLLNEIKEKYKNEIEKEAEDNISFFDVKVFAEFHLQEKCKEYHEEIMNVMTVYDYYLDEEMKDEIQEIYFSQPYSEKLKDYIHQNYPSSKMIDSWKDECCFRFPPLTNLKDIFLYDYGLKKYGMNRQGSSFTY